MKQPVSQTIAPRSPCAISGVLERMGDKWSLLIIRDMLFYGKHEFKEFLSSPEGIATNVLSDRLKKLCAAELIEESDHPQSKLRKFYYLTRKGKELLPLLSEMVVWADKNLEFSPVMKPIAAKLKKDRQKFAKELLDRAAAWEKQNLNK